MHIFHITPHQFMFNTPQFNYLVESPWLLSDPEGFKPLKTFVRETRIILDHGLALGASISFAKYAELINQVKPAFCVLPDVWKDKDATITAALECRKALEEVQEYQMILPLQGNTIDAIVVMAIDCADIFGEDVRLGLPYKLFNGPTSVERAAERLRCARRIMSSDVVNPLHFLGLWDWTEVAAARSIGVRSCDSSLAFLLASEGKDYLGYRNVNYGWKEASERACDITLLLRNCTELTRIASGHII